MSDRTPSPEQLAQFYRVLGSQHLQTRTGYRVDGAAPLYQTSFDLSGVPTVDVAEMDAAQTLDLRGFARVQWGAQVRAVQPGLTAHLHWSKDGTAWHDFGEPDVALDDPSGTPLSQDVAIPEAAQPFARLGLVLEGGDGTTPVDATVIVTFR